MLSGAPCSPSHWATSRFVRSALARNTQEPKSLSTPKSLAEIVQGALDRFYTRRLALFDKLDLRELLRRKNPYLFRAMGINDPAHLVNSLLSAYLSSSDEGIFGDAFFEPVA